MCERNVMLCSKPGEQMIDVHVVFPFLSMPVSLTEKYLYHLFTRLKT